MLVTIDGNPTADTTAGNIEGSGRLQNRWAGHCCDPPSGGGRDSYSGPIGVADSCATNKCRCCDVDNVSWDSNWRRTFCSWDLLALDGVAGQSTRPPVVDSRRPETRTF